MTLQFIRENGLEEDYRKHMRQKSDSLLERKREKKDGN